MDECINNAFKTKCFLEGVVFSNIKKLISHDIETILVSHELIGIKGSSPEEIARINSFLVHLRNDVEKLRGFAEDYSSIPCVKKEYWDILAMLDSKLPKEYVHYIQEFFG